MITLKELKKKINEKDIFSEESINEILSYPDHKEVIMTLIKFIAKLDLEYTERIEKISSSFESRLKMIEIKIDSSRSIINELNTIVTDIEKDSEKDGQSDGRTEE